jgi:hypothetical protein
MGFFRTRARTALVAPAGVLSVQGVKSAGKGGSSRIKVIVTRLLGDI